MPITPSVSASLTSEKPRPRRWTAQEFFRAANLGLFGSDERLELIHGEIIEKMPTDPPHSGAIELVRAALVAAFAGIQCTMKSENPLVISESNAPQPDVLVLRGSIRQYTQRHPVPEDVLLLVEIANTTLLTDRRNKGRLYAAAGISEFWIVNLRDRCLEVFRDAHDDNWTTVFTVPELETIAPLAVLDSSFTVNDLLL